MENAPIVGVIAAVIAFFAAASFLKNSWIQSIFGEVAGYFVLLLVLIIMIILLVPFYRALKLNIGQAPAVFVILIGIWVIFKFLFNPYESDFFSNFNAPYQFYNFYDAFTNPATLIILLVAGALFSLIKMNKRR